MSLVRLPLPYAAASEPFELNECINVALNVFVILGPRV